MCFQTAMLGCQGYIRAVGDETDLEDLAKRYLYLWREQIPENASDMQMIESLSRNFTTFGQVVRLLHPHRIKLKIRQICFPDMPMLRTSQRATELDAAFRAFTGQAAIEQSLRTEPAVAHKPPLYFRTYCRK